MSLEGLIEGWDGETVIVRHDGPTGAWIFIAIHSTRLGHAGERAERDVVEKVRGALEEVFAVAAAGGISTAEAAARIAARRLGEAG